MANKRKKSRTNETRFGSSMSSTAARSSRGIYRIVERTFRSSFVTSVPLFVNLFLGVTYFLAFQQLLVDPESYPMFWSAGNSADPTENYQAELLEQKFYIGSYALSLLIIAFNLKAFIAFFWRERTLLISISILLFTSIVSDNPDRVFIGVMHLSFGVFAIWFYLQDERRKTNILKYCCIGVAIPVVTNLTLSTILYFIREPNFLDPIFAGGRYSGLSGNPNTLGANCVVGAWAICSLISMTTLRSKTMVLCILALLVIAFNLFTTGSATAQTIVGFIVILLILNGFRKQLSKTANVALIVILTAGFFGLSLSLVIKQNADEFASGATESVGKDLTLTGRTDLWPIALEAISERPLLGYSYDNHDTVMSNPSFDVPYNHYHNGYLDSLLVGGVVFGLSILLCYFALVGRYFRVSSQGQDAFPLLLAVAAPSIHNFTEYSMFRSNTPIWQLFFVALIAVSLMSYSNSSNAQRKTKPTRNRRGRSSVKSESNPNSDKRYRW